MAACTTLVISFTFYNLAEVLFRLFSQDDAVVAVGVGMMHVLTPVYITYVCIEVLAGALRGCGDVRVPTLITVFFVCGLRMLWLFIAVPIRHEVATVEMSYPITCPSRPRCLFCTTSRAAGCSGARRSGKRSRQGDAA